MGFSVPFEPTVYALEWDLVARSCLRSSAFIFEWRVLKWFCSIQGCARHVTRSRRSREGEAFVWARTANGCLSGAGRGRLQGYNGVVRFFLLTAELEMQPLTTHRRDFLSGSVSTAVAAGLAQGGFFSSVKASDTKKLGVALVGLGSLSAGQIAPALRKSKSCQLTAIVTGNQTKGQMWAEQYGIARRSIYDYEGFDKIVNDDSVDIAYIALPNFMHREYAIRAARAGKHVLCETPMATTARDCRDIIAECKKADRVLAIGDREQFNSTHLKMMELARTQQFGSIERIEAEFGYKIKNSTQWRLRKSVSGGGALVELGVHALQACRRLTGEEPVRIVAQETKTDANKFAEVDESVTWCMQFASGTLAYCSTSFNFEGLNRLTVYGKDGFMQLDPAFSCSGTRIETSRGALELPLLDPFAAQLDSFAECIREGKPPKVSGEQGLRDALAIEAIYRSIETRASVALERA